MPKHRGDQPHRQTKSKGPLVNLSGIQAEPYEEQRNTEIFDGAPSMIYC